MIVILRIFIVISNIGDTFKPSFEYFLYMLWEAVHASAFCIAFALFFKLPYVFMAFHFAPLLVDNRSSSTAIALDLIINVVSVIPFLSSTSNRLLPITALPGGAIVLFTRNFLNAEWLARKQSMYGLIISILSSVVYIVIAYITMYIREDVFNLLDRVCS